jgi:cytochrome c556
MKSRHGLIRLSALLAGIVLCVAGRGGAADDSKARENLLKAAEALEKNDAAAAKTAIQALQKEDVDVVMDLLKLRSKGGIGVGEAKGAIKPDGVEAKIQALDKAAPSPKEAQADSAALARAGYTTAAVADAVMNKVPMDKKKQEAQWKGFAKEMRTASMNFAKAAQSKDGAKIQAAAKELNNSCIKCHDMFR